MSLLTRALEIAKVKQYNRFLSDESKRNFLEKIQEVFLLIRNELKEFEGYKCPHGNFKYYDGKDNFQLQIYYLNKVDLVLNIDTYFDSNSTLASIIFGFPSVFNREKKFIKINNSDDFYGLYDRIAEHLAYYF